MKKLLLFLSFTFLSVGVFSQSLTPIKYGLKVGINLANGTFTTDSAGVKLPATTMQIGPQVGFVMQIALSEKWFLNPEILYSQKGVKFDYDYKVDIDTTRFEFTTTNNLVLTYIVLNPDISYRANEKISLNFGPSINYLLSNNLSVSTTIGKETTESSPEVEDANSIDVGLNLGLSYHFNTHLVLNGRVFTGFLPIETNDKDLFSMTNRAFTFSVAYLF